MKRPVRLLAVLALAVMLTACRVDAEVEVEVAEDGSGLVTVAVSLDDEAVERAGDLNRLLVTGDLAAAGWRVDGSAREGDGLTWVRASKAFADPDDLIEVLAEVSPAFDVDLDRRSGLGRTVLDLNGTIDLSNGLDAFGDAQLDQLFGSRAGVDVAALEDEIGPLAEAVEVRFVVQMPFDVSANGDTTDGEAEWVIRPGDDVVDVDASASETHTATTVWAVASFLFALSFVGVVGRRAWRAYSGADLIPHEYAQPAQPGPGAPDGDDDEQPAGRQLELVVIDAFGVLFDAADDVTSLLGSFVAANGGTADGVEIDERYRQASLGRLTTDQFWYSLGLDDEAAHLDFEFVSRLPLADGALMFLERAKLQGLGIVCLANGVSRWFEPLRRRDSLDVYCETWLISSDLGVRKPDPAAFEAVTRATGVPLSNCLMIDDRVEHLDAARRAGMSTALYGSRPHTGVHPRIEDFGSLLA